MIFNIIVSIPKLRDYNNITQALFSRIMTVILFLKTYLVLENLLKLITNIFTINYVASH